MTRDERIKSLENAITVLKEELNNLKKEKIIDELTMQEIDFRRENPAFDLRTEIKQNKKFCEYLALGYTVKAAYEETHKKQRR